MKFRIKFLKKGQNFHKKDRMKFHKDQTITP